jgi:hypothetical protein
MRGEEAKPNFWTTLPGILTGIAAVVAAAGGIILGLHQAGAAGGGQGHADSVTPNGVSAPTLQQGAPASQRQSAMPSPSVSASTPAGQPRPSAAAPAATSPDGDDIPPKAVRVTKTDGTVMWSFEDQFRLAGCKGSECSFAFKSGQLVPFDKIKTLDVLGVDAEGKRNMRAALTNGKVIEGLSDNSLFVEGTNDVGEIRVDENQVKRVAFPH